MSAYGTVVRVAVLATCMSARVLPQAHQHAAPNAESLGTVHFRTSCAPAVAPTFDRGVSLLHSFEFAAAIRAFNSVLSADATCAMADWGIALSRWTNPMTITGRPPATLAAGRLAASAASSLAPSATERERGYIRAVNLLYADYEHTAQRDRVIAYEKAMSDVATGYPTDTEAVIFHALALVASAPPTDKTYANQLRAGATLERLWAAQPDHPGLAHYIIHAYDVAALAPHAQRAAARYANIAPSAAHALHMPSHTFTRVGMWKESIETNLRSIAVARSDSSFGETLHASDYLMYAYLQQRHDSAASGVLRSLPAIAREFNPDVIAGAAPGSAGMFALVAIPARWVLERRAWTEAAALTPKPSAFPYTEAMTYFVRALGAAHTGDSTGADAAIAALDDIRDRLTRSGEGYWAEQVAIEAVEAGAVRAQAAGRLADAEAAMRDAVAREDATEKSAVTPGPLVPAHELFGDMLMDLHKPANALAEFRLSIAREPNRFRGLYGAMMAARASGARSAALKYSAQVERLTGSTVFTRRGVTVGRR